MENIFYLKGLNELTDKKAHYNTYFILTKAAFIWSKITLHNFTT